MRSCAAMRSAQEPPFVAPDPRAPGSVRSAGVSAGGRGERKPFIIHAFPCPACGKNRNSKAHKRTCGKATR
jgi:hypothetical protein